MAETDSTANDADTTETAKPNGEQPASPNMRILGQFIRDLSFENIVSRKGVSGDVSPNVSVQVSLDAKKRSQENQYEVIGKFVVTSENKETQDTLFMLELEYGGIFEVQNVPEAQLHPYLLIECPRMMFPYVRRIVSDVTHDGGFPALNLEQIDFVALYRQSLAQRQAAAQQAEGPSQAS